MTSRAARCVEDCSTDIFDSARASSRYGDHTGIYTSGGSVAKRRPIARRLKSRRNPKEAQHRGQVEEKHCAIDRPSPRQGTVHTCTHADQLRWVTLAAQVAPCGPAWWNVRHVAQCMNGRSQGAHGGPQWRVRWGFSYVRYKSCAKSIPGVS